MEQGKGPVRHSPDPADNIVPMPRLPSLPEPVGSECTQPGATHTHVRDLRPETFKTIIGLLSSCEREVSKAADLLAESIKKKEIANPQDLIEAKTCFKKAAQAEVLLLEMAKYAAPSACFESDITAIFGRIHQHRESVASFVELARTPSSDLREKIEREITELARVQTDLYVLNQALGVVLSTLTGEEQVDVTATPPRESA